MCVAMCIPLADAASLYSALTTRVIVETA
jgi:hypothetical protein